MAQAAGRQVKAGDTFHHEVFTLQFPVTMEITSAEQLLRYVDYMSNPDGLRLVQGKRVNSAGAVELEPDNFSVELAVPKPHDKLELTLPVIVRGLNRRWAAVLWQKQGYVLGNYGTGNDRCRALGIDFQGNAYVPMYVDWAEMTHVVAGHPIVADENGRQLFIQVTKLAERPFRWHVSVNNASDQIITTTLRKTMDLPGLDFKETKLTLKPGEYRVLAGSM